MAVVIKFHSLAAVLALVGLLCACSSFPWERTDNRNSAESRDFYRARMAKEVEVMVAMPGVKVCRQFTAGIGNREWVRGVVVEAAAGSIRVRIDDPGQYLHTVNGIELLRGSLIQDVIDAWIPCL